MPLLIPSDANRADLDRTIQDFCKRQTAANCDDDITARHYLTLQDAFNYFNSQLFDNRLPQVLITLQRHPHALGYFSADDFSAAGKARAEPTKSR